MPRKVKNVDAPERLSSKALAEEFGVTLGAVRSWVIEKCPFTKDEKGRLQFDPAEVASWRRARGMDTRGSNRGSSPDIDAARLRKENALADKYELHVARERGVLIAADDAKRTYGNFVRVMRNRLQRVGATVASRWPGPDAGRLQGLIDAEVAEALRDVSQTDEPSGESLASTV